MGQEYFKWQAQDAQFARDRARAEKMESEGWLRCDQFLTAAKPATPAPTPAAKAAEPDDDDGYMMSRGEWKEWVLRRSVWAEEAATVEETADHEATPAGDTRAAETE